MATKDSQMGNQAVMSQNTAQHWQLAYFTTDGRKDFENSQDKGMMSLSCWMY